jgi:hypothetical protein
MNLRGTLPTLILQSLERQPDHGYSIALRSFNNPPDKLTPPLRVSDGGTALTSGFRPSRALV